MPRTLLVATMLSTLWIASPSTADLTDPTRPAMRPVVLDVDATKSDATAELSLDSVMISTTGRFAVVNGKRVRVGDTVQGSVVAEITLSGVRLRRGEADVILTLTDTGIAKTEPANWTSR